MPVYDSTSAFLRQQLKNFREASKADKVLRAAALYAAPAVQSRANRIYSLSSSCSASSNTSRTDGILDC